jgi:hypothetical protein
VKPSPGPLITVIADHRAELKCPHRREVIAVS